MELDNFLGEGGAQNNGMELSMSQRFELERMLRAIDSANSLEEIKGLTKMLASSWMAQKAWIAWTLKSQLPIPPTLES